MSKRFGRNQRRRAREQLAALEYENGLLLTQTAMQDGSLQKAAKEVQLLRQQLDNAKIVIGRNHPAFPPGQMDMGFMPAPGDRFSVSTGPRDIATAALMSVSTDRDTVFNEVHFILMHGDKRAGYIVSERAMREAGAEERGYLCNNIATLLVDHIIEAYQTAKSRGRR